LRVSYMRGGRGGKQAPACFSEKKEGGPREKKGGREGVSRDFLASVPHGNVFVEQTGTD